MSRPFVLSLFAAALAATGSNAFVPPQPKSTSSFLYAKNNVEEQPTRRDVFQTLAVGMITAAAASPSAALADIIVDTDEFGQEVEYDDEESSEKKSGEGGGNNIYAEKCGEFYAP